MQTSCYGKLNKQVKIKTYDYIIIVSNICVYNIEVINIEVPTYTPPQRDVYGEGDLRASSSVHHQLTRDMTEVLFSFL